MGDAILQLLNAGIGIFLAFLHISMLKLVWPDGSQGMGDAAFWTSMVSSMTFMFVIPWLHFPPVTVIFACSRGATWWMQFSDWDVNSSMAMRQELGAWLVGASAAIAANLFPTPWLATRETHHLSEEVVTTLQVCWHDFGDFFCGGTRKDVEMSRLTADLQSLTEKLRIFQDKLNSSWWEVGWISTLSPSYTPRVGHMLAMMQRQHTMVNAALGRLQDVKFLCHTEAFDADHADAMHPCYNVVDRILLQCCDTMQLCGRYSRDGVIDEAEAEDLQARLSELKEGETLLTKTYFQAKEAIIERNRRNSV